MLIPAIFLALVFGRLLASGNAIFQSWTGNFFNWLGTLLETYLNPGRLFTWFVVIFMALPLLRPRQAGPGQLDWRKRVLSFPAGISPQNAVFSSGLVLLVLNVLFLVANTADALFLWSGQPLPAGVSYKSYVHEGVGVLIATVILSALVMTIIFQQEASVSRRRELKYLAYAWVVQNLFLMISVGEKIRRYIATYEMTVARLSTLIFLLLVGAGFVLLTLKIARNRSLIWLVGGCLLAAFAQLYLTQFLDLAGWSANYNLAVMEHDPAHRFDAPTMCEWGPDVWPALRRARDLAPDDVDLAEAFHDQQVNRGQINRAGKDWQHWREFSLRAYWNRWGLDEPHK